MRMKTAGLISASMAGALLFTGVAISASSGTTHETAKSAHAALAVYTPPTTGLDNCPTLATGSHGGCVNQLQTELNTIDSANLSVDGTFGDATQAAVEAFQQAYGLPQDGVVGPATKQAIDAALTTPVSSGPLPASSAPAPASSAAAPQQADDPNLPTYPFDIPDLGNCPSLIPQIFQYSDGVLAPQGCVAALQQSLVAVGFNLFITGDYEPSTYAAVWNFQLAHSGDYGLSASGWADSSTIAALDKIANSPAALSPVNGADVNGNGLVQPSLPATITKVQLVTNTQPTIEDLPDDCATTCEDDNAAE
jgi:peptidoglycan hydrolase-like protein with peptidoglycan-binding domain